MMRGKPTTLIQRDCRLSHKMQASYLVSPTIVGCNNGMLLSTLKLDGVHLDTLPATEVQSLQALWHQVIVSMNDRCACHVTSHRRPLVFPANINDQSDFSCHVRDSYQQQFNDLPLYVNDYYLTVIHLGAIPSAMANQWLNLKRSSYASVMASRRQFKARQIRDLTTAVSQAQQSLAFFKPILLKEGSGGSIGNGIFDFLSLFINAGKPSPIRRFTKQTQRLHGSSGDSATLPQMHLASYLSQYRVCFGRHVQFNGINKDDVIVGAMISIKHYGEFTDVMMMSALNHLSVPYIQVNSFAMDQKGMAQRRVRRHLNKMQSLDDPAVTQMVQLTQAQDDIQSDRIKLGLHQQTLMVIASDEAMLESRVQQVAKAFLMMGMVPVRETLGQECAFWSLMPGHFNHMARRALISSHNFADLTFFDGQCVGDKEGSHLKAPMTMAITAARSPCYVNCHAPVTGEGFASGHTLVIGGNGCGKTVTLCFFDAQLKQFGGRSVFFDRNRGCEVYVRACGGHYRILSPDHPSDLSLNPFQLPNNHKNRQFVKLWMRQLLIDDIDQMDPMSIQAISDAVDYAFFQLAPDYRTLTNVAKHLPVNFIYHEAMQQWLVGPGDADSGDYAYLFDHVNDCWSTADTLGFDMTHFLDHEPKRVLSAVMMVLFYRIELQLDGRLTSVFLDEGWQYLDHVGWQSMLRRWLATWRKLNAHIIFSTQSAHTVVQSSLCATLLDNVATMILFPSPQAQWCDYVNGLSLTDKEFHLIKTKSPLDRFFLYKQAGMACWCRCPLSSLSDCVQVFSSTVVSQQACEKARDQAGEDPRHWLPLFYRLLNEKK